MAQEIALVTGASSGIGEALARRLARDRRHLALVARRADRLDALAAELHQAHAVEVHTIAADLVRPGAAGALVAELERRDLAVDWLVNNAGFGTNGRFHELPIERELEEITLNVEVLAELTGRLVPAMVRRGRGVVMNVSSIGGYMPTPYMSTYTATKAFVLSFSEGLSTELAGTGVRVLCVCPGATRTEFQQRADLDPNALPSFAWQSAEQVADEAVHAAARGGVLVNGILNRVMLGAVKFMPRSLTMRVTAGMFRPREA